MVITAGGFRTHIPSCPLKIY